jgi:5-formaminoimidazole-4-carboxamide-1-(beta)-D-ribofuranosyl 5'-monophosphate synthetase
MMIRPTEAAGWAREYPRPLRVAAVASHSALDTFDGAVTEGFPTLALCQTGRERTYTHYFRTRRDPEGRRVRGCVDDVQVLATFKDLLKEETLSDLRSKGAILVPNRALTSYLEVADVEDRLRLPLLGSRGLLRIEERTERENYYTLLARAGIPTPEEVKEPRGIEGLTLVKLPHARKRLERGFFTCASFEEYQRKAEALTRMGVTRPEDLARARMERYVLGPVFNLNFFYSPLAPRDEALELLGIDERRESSLDGLVRLPAEEQLELPASDRIPEYTVVGHGSLTLRESLLEEAFRLGERFVRTARESHPPGVVGPFCLQTCVDKDQRFFVFDVAVRLGGGTNIHMALGHPYGNTLWREPMSSARRLARELSRAVREDRLAEVVT